MDHWGNVLQEHNPQGIHQAIRLPGQHHDRETGLYYNRHRYYDPVVGSYINQDPIGLMGGTNPCGYVRNSPVNLADPLGLEPGTMAQRGYLEWLTPLRHRPPQSSYARCPHGKTTR
nr:RHS repeat-associated core domain-containing protein [Delftia acidovorans]